MEHANSAPAARIAEVAKKGDTTREQRGDGPAQRVKVLLVLAQRVPPRRGDHITIQRLRSTRRTRTRPRLR